MKNRADCVRWSTTISSASLHQTWSGDAGARDLLDPVHGASKAVRLRAGARCAADLDAGERLQRTGAGDASELLVAEAEVRHGVEGDGSGEQSRMPADEKKRLLSAHAAADRVHALRVDSQPGAGLAEDRRHPREVVDLTPPAPGVERKASSHSAGTDDGERPARR